jgi:cobalamin biosynthesis Mg chelatase CobN
MKRRIRSSLDGSRRGALLCLAIGLGLTLGACSSDLFHDTKWQSRCDTEPDAAICPQGTGGAGGTSATTSESSASSSASAAQSSSASSTAGAGGGTSTSTSTGADMMATSSSTGP